MQAWMDRANTSAKLALLALLLALPCALLGLRLLQLEWQSWLVARQEAQGVPIAASLVRAQLALMQQRGQAGLLLVRSDSPLPPFQAAQQALLQALDQAQQALQHPGIQASTRAALERQRRELEKLSAAVVGRGLTPRQSELLHQAQLRALVELTLRVLHDSQLSYDPSVDGYHLIVANFEAMPQLLDTLGRLRALSAMGLAAGEPQRQQILQLQGELNDRLSRVQLHHELAAQANPGLQPELPGVALELEVAQLRQLSRQTLLEGGAEPARAAASFESMGQSIARLVAQSLRTQEALQTLLARRAGDAQLVLLALGGTGLVWGLLCLLMAVRLLRAPRARTVLVPASVVAKPMATDTGVMAGATELPRAA